jgi:hypothetical protein
MARAVSIHLGVNRPGGRFACRPLRHSEDVAWRMAGLAVQAGYDALTVLRGEAATRAAVHDALTRAAGLLTVGDHLLVSFSGHGSQERDIDRDEGHGWDEAWCLSDGVLIDDRLAGYWRLFERGVRIVVVADSCYSGGSAREGEAQGYAAPPTRPAHRVMRGGASGFRGPAPPSAAADTAGSYIVECPHDTDGIQASLLLLSASGEDHTARENLFAGHLLEVWSDGAFQGSYWDLHRQVRERVMTEHGSQEPCIQMLGASDPAFPLETAFHLDRRAARGSTVYR